jgi:5-hydroxyisourate hydrolase-like protein (transthyretin family)
MTMTLATFFATPTVGFAIGAIALLGLSQRSARAPESQQSRPAITASILGRVVDTASRPIARVQASVWLASSDPKDERPRLVTAETGKEGYFELSLGPPPTPRQPPRAGISKETLTIRFARAGYVDAMVHREWPDAKNPSFDIGAVTMSDESRIAGAVEYQAEDPERRDRITATPIADANAVASSAIGAGGRFRIVGLQPGKYLIGTFDHWGAQFACEVLIDGEKSPGNSVTVLHGHEARIRVRVVERSDPTPRGLESKGGRTLVGQALDRNGKPMIGVMVAVGREAGYFYRTTTDASGRITIENAREAEAFEVAVIREHDVLARGRILGSDTKPFVLRAGALPKMPSVILTIYDVKSGAPIRNATTKIGGSICGLDDEGQQLAAIPPAKPQETEPGVYRVPYIPDGFRSFTIAVRAEGYGGVCTNEISIVSFDDVGPIAVPMAQGGSVVARVVNEFTGKPVAGLMVRLTRDTSEFNEVLLDRFKATDDEGIVRIDSVPPGAHVLGIFGDSRIETTYVNDVAIEAGKTTNLECKVRVEGTLRIGVFDSRGKRVERAFFAIKRGDSYVDGTMDDLGHGSFAFQSIDSGPCRVEAYGGELGEATLSAEAEIRAGEDTVVVLKGKS